MTGLTPAEDVAAHEKNWFDCIRSNKEPNCNVDLSLRGQTVISLAEMSNRLKIACLYDEKTGQIPPGMGRKSLQSLTAHCRSLERQSGATFDTWQPLWGCFIASGTGVSPVRIESHRQDARATKNANHPTRLQRDGDAIRVCAARKNPLALRASGEEAIREIQRLESQLSLYRPSSEIAHLNARAAREPVRRFPPPVFALLKQAKRLSEETAGAFDITIAPLVRCWGFMGGSGKLPDAAALARARKCIGMDKVHLDPATFTVSFEHEGVMLDLGAIGKGHAVQEAGEILRDHEVTSALIHGGTSTVCAIGRPPDAECWKVAIEAPQSRREAPNSPPAMTLIATVPLKDEALSVSAIWGKSFEAEGRTLGHVLDPRTGTPVSGAVLSAVVSRSAGEGDAFSTALLVCGREEQEQISRLRPGLKTLVVAGADEAFRVDSNGIALEDGNHLAG